MRRYLIWLTVLGLFTLPVQSWHIPHALTALGVVAAIAISSPRAGTGSTGGPWLALCC